MQGSDPTKRAGLTPLNSQTTRPSEAQQLHTDALGGSQSSFGTTGAQRKKVESPWADPQVLKTVHSNFDRILQGVNQSNGVRVAKFGEISSFDDYQRRASDRMNGVAASAALSPTQSIEQSRALASSTAVVTAGNPNIRRRIV